MKKNLYVLLCLRDYVPGIENVKGSLSNRFGAEVVNEDLYDDKNEAVEKLRSCKSRILGNQLEGDVDWFEIEGYVLQQHDLASDGTEVVTEINSTYFEFELISENGSVIGVYPTYLDAVAAEHDLYVQAQQEIVGGDDDVRREALAKLPIVVRLPY